MITAKVGRLIEARLDKGLDKTALGKACGVSHSIIVRIEQGGGTSPRTAKAISETLGSPVRDLFEFVPREGGEIIGK